MNYIYVYEAMIFKSLTGRYYIFYSEWLPPSIADRFIRGSTLYKNNYFVIHLLAELPKKSWISWIIVSLVILCVTQTPRGFNFRPRIKMIIVPSNISWLPPGKALIIRRMQMLHTVYLFISYMLAELPKKSWIS